MIGTPVRSFAVSNNAHWEFVSWESNEHERHYRVGNEPWDARGGTALIQFADGSGVALAILPGYVGTALVTDGQVRAITYAVANDTREYDDYLRRREVLDERRAIAIAAASIGKLEELSRRVGDALASYIRVDKLFDPCLGVLAAYSYFLNGNEEKASSIWQYMSSAWVWPREGGSAGPVRIPVPFDVAMLAGKLNEAAGPGFAGVAPFCPWLSLGWTLLDMFEPHLNPAIVEAGRHRQPGTWTSFTERGIDVLRAAMNSKEIQ